MVKWEYKTFEWEVLKHALNESQKPENLGGQGWELVSTNYVSKGPYKITVSMCIYG